MEEIEDGSMDKYERFRRVEKLLKEAKKNFNEVLSSEFDRGSEDGFPLRGRYLSAMNSVCESFGVEPPQVELEESEDELDKVYSEWNNHVNMTASELREWSQNPCSREASVDPVAVIKRNLRLLERDKDEWTSNDVEDAKRTISFISRMKPNRPDSPREGPHGCPSEWAISLLNWAFNPFDSVPSPNSEVKKDLEPVEEVTLAAKEADYEFSPVPDQVVYADIELAAERARSMGMEGENPEDVTHEHVLVLGGEEVTMYMPGDEHSDWVDAVNHPRQKSVESSELSETRQASQVFHGDQEKHLNRKQTPDEDDGEGSVEVPPVAIHKVDSAERKSDDDVEKVLDRLWEDDE